MVKILNLILISVLLISCSNKNIKIKNIFISKKQQVELLGEKENYSNVYICKKKKFLTKDIPVTIFINKTQVALLKKTTCTAFYLNSGSHILYLTRNNFLARDFYFYSETINFDNKKNYFILVDPENKSMKSIDLNIYKNISNGIHYNKIKPSNMTINSEYYDVTLETLWAECEHSKEAPKCEYYLLNYPNGKYSKDAKALLEKIYADQEAAFRKKELVKQLLEKAYSKETIQSYKDVLTIEPENLYAQEMLNKLTEKQKKVSFYNKNFDTFLSNKDFEGLMNFITENKEAKYYINPPELRILFIGPNKLKIGHIRKLLLEGIGSPIILAKIRRVNSGYKDLTTKEILLLKSWGFKDDVIAALIDKTTDFEKEEEKRLEAESIANQEIANFENADNNNLEYTESNSNNITENKFLNAFAEEAGRTLGEEALKLLINALFN